jgi:hypothetical protein
MHSVQEAAGKRLLACLLGLLLQLSAMSPGRRQCAGHAGTFCAHAAQHGSRQHGSAGNARSRPLLTRTALPPRRSALHAATAAGQSNGRCGACAHTCLTRQGAGVPQQNASLTGVGSTTPLPLLLPLLPLLSFFTSSTVSNTSTGLVGRSVSTCGGRIRRACAAVAFAA